MRILIVGNWKMAPEKVADAKKLAAAAKTLARTNKNKLSLVICPPFIHIPAVVAAAKALPVGGQSVSEHIEAPHTGEVSAGMLKSLGASYCLIGHSEVRAMMQGAEQANEAVHAQLVRLLEKKLIPILCVGEAKRDGQGWYLSAVKDQLESALAGVPKAALKRVVIAYEPVWAIGKGAVREATPAECAEMVIFIRKVISDLYDEKAGKEPQILYGGSVDEKNARRFIDEGKAQGLLVGRVSLEPKRFGVLMTAVAGAKI